MDGLQHALDRTHHFIGGAWVEPSRGAFGTIVAPATELEVGRYAVGSTEDVDRAVASAREALVTGPWPRLTLEERAEVLLRALDLLEGSGSVLDAVITSEMGAPISFRMTSAGIGISRALLAERSVLRSDPRSGPRGTAIVTHEPVGVVAALTTWNGPLATLLTKSLSALLVGSTVVAKPPLETPVDGFLFAEALRDAGVPPGAFNLLAGDAEAGAHLVSHPGVDRVTFTGSTAVGRSIAAACGAQLKRVSLELGGKSPAVVLDDADPGLVAASVATVFGNSGQACNALTRLVIPDALHDEVVEAIVATARSLRIGDPFDETTQMGPLVSARHRERVAGYVAVADEEGARRVCGGGVPDAMPRGYYFEPTVFVDVTPSMRIAREEVFGPVLAVLRHSGSDDEAIAVADSTEYGLNAAVFSADARRAFAVAQRIRSGMVTINGHVSNPFAPFGGVKGSGLGREFGPEGLAECAEVKTINVPRPDDLEAITRLL